MKQKFSYKLVSFFKVFLRYIKRETEEEKLVRLFKNAYIKSQTCSYTCPNSQKIVVLAAKRVADKMRVTSNKYN